MEIAGFLIVITVKVVAMLVIGIVVAAVTGYVSYKIGYRRAKENMEPGCDNCRFREMCETYKTSNCTWCKHWEDEGIEYENKL